MIVHRFSREFRGALRDYTAVLSAQLGVLPLSLLWLGLIAQVLGPQKFGSYLIGIAVVQCLFRVLIGWASDAVIRFGSSEALQSQRLNRTVSTRLVLLALCSVLGIVVLEGGRPFLQQWAGLSSEAIYLLSAVLISTAWWDLGLSINRALGAIPRYALGSWLRQLLLITGAGCIWAGVISRSVESVLAVEAAAYAMVGWWLILRAGLGIFYPVRIEWSSLLQIARYAWSNIVSFLTGYLTDWVDLYIIRYFLGVFHVGIYQFGYRLMLLASNGLMGIIVVTFPLLMRWKAEGKSEAIKAYAEEFTPKVSWLWSVAMAGLIAVSPEVVGWLGGPEYQSTGPILAVLWAGLAFQVLAVMTAPFFSAFDALSTVMALNLAMAIMNIVGDLVAVPRWGIQGAAWATALSYTIIGLAYGWCASRQFDVRLGSAWFFPWMGWATWVLCQLSPSLLARGALALGVVGIWTWLARMRSLQPTEMLTADTAPSNSPSIKR